MHGVLNILKVGALFLIIALAIGLYKAVPPPREAASSTLSGVKIEQASQNTLSLNGQIFYVDLAKTAEERQLGLSGRESLAQDRGMLFVFDKPGKWGFWMKDMAFPIDIIWLDKNFNPVEVVENLSPNSYPKTFYPKEPALYTLELPAGTWQKLLLSTE